MRISSGEVMFLVSEAKVAETSGFSSRVLFAGEAPAGEYNNERR